MNITITGATGFIGRRLVSRLSSEGHALHILSRSGSAKGVASGVRVSQWNPVAGEPPAESLAQADAVIHLAGEPVAQRWTPEVKKLIMDSRSRGTRHLVQALSTQSRRPQVLVSASAIGYYGARGEETLTETSTPGKGFLPEVCVDWEKQAELAESLGIRVVRLRIGIVLGLGGGALEKMMPSFQAFVGGKLGSGSQWMSWIHLDDLVGIIHHALTTSMQGPVNGTAPKPATNLEFTQALASALGRPAIFPVPAFVVKALFGEMSSVLLGSQRVLPRAASASGYRYQYPELPAALKNIVG